MQLYHDSSEREPVKRAGDNSRSEESQKLVSCSQARFLVVVHEALGLSYTEVLDSGYSLIEAMMQEYSYVMNERNKSLDSSEEGKDGDNYEWVELPSWDEPTQIVKIKKYDNIGLA